MPQDPNYIDSGAPTLQETRGVVGDVFGLLGDIGHSAYEGTARGLKSGWNALGDLPAKAGYYTRAVGRGVNNILPPHYQAPLMDLLVSGNPMVAGLTADWRNPMPAGMSTDDEMAALAGHSVHNLVNQIVSTKSRDPRLFAQLAFQADQARQYGYDPKLLDQAEEYAASYGTSGDFLRPNGMSTLLSRNARTQNIRPARRGDPDYASGNRAPMPGTSVRPWDPMDTITRALPWQKVVGMSTNAAIASKNPVISNIAKRATFYGTKNAVKNAGKGLVGAVKSTAKRSGLGL